MATTITISATEKYNTRYAPAGAKKAYLARLLGRSISQTFEREFLAKSYDFDAASCPALLERVDVAKDGSRYSPDYMLLVASGEEVVQFDLEKADAMWLAAQMDAGRNLADCWNEGGRVSPKAAAKEQVAVTVTAAIESCWKMLEVLPEKEAKKVLAALKARVSPPKPRTDPAIEAQPVATETPAE